MEIFDYSCDFWCSVLWIQETYLFPYYVASSTFTINSSITSENSNTYIENATANQMAKSFPYILKSGAFKEVLAQDFGLQSVPGTIEAEVMENTNLFTLKVTAKIKNDNV